MNLYLYFSGTGNTKYVVTKFSKGFEDAEAYKIASIEQKNVLFSNLIETANIITIAFPIYGSMMPYILSDFLTKYKESFRDKKIITIVTQLYFSGDGGALPYHILKDVNVNHLHSIHINMPSNITDIKLFPLVTLEESAKYTAIADIKINKVIALIKAGKTIKHGRKWYSWALGFFTQRAYAKWELKRMRSRVKIDHNLCVNCNLCVKNCPTENLVIEEGIVKAKSECTLCYRCVNLCPTKAISIFSKKKPKKQYIREEFN